MPWLRRLLAGLRVLLGALGLGVLVGLALGFLALPALFVLLLALLFLTLTLVVVGHCLRLSGWEVQGCGAPFVAGLVVGVAAE